MLNALFSSAFYFLHADFVICFLLIAKYPEHPPLYFQHLCSSCMLGQSSSLKDALTHPLSKRHSQGVCISPQGCLEGCDE